jgi:adenosylcobinamide-phosphate synthase
MLRRSPLALGLLIGTALDTLVPDPRRGHPVAAFGAAASRLEQHIYGDSRVRGAAYVALSVGGIVVGARAVERRSGVVGVAIATWTVLGGRSLRAEAHGIEQLLARNDLDAARHRITHLVGRDPAGLDAAGIARAAVESVAENTCDAVVAPLLWGAVCGLPGLLGYRAVNTLDAMVGHRSPRYANFGWAAARADDIANFVPARLTALLAALAAPLAGGDPRAALRIARRDGRNHPSPNSGRSEAAFAGALGLRLGGRNVYGGRVEQRPSMGDGRPPARADLRRVATLSAVVTAAAAAVAALVARR